MHLVKKVVAAAIMFVGAAFLFRLVFAEALVRYAFDELKVNRLYASHVPHNPASGTILLKLGMKREGYLRGHILKWGEYQDLVLYGMVKEDLRRDAA